MGKRLERYKIHQIVISRTKICLKLPLCKLTLPLESCLKCFGFGESNTKSLLCIRRVSFTFPLPSYIRPFLLFVTPHPNFPDRRRGMQRRDASHKKPYMAQLYGRMETLTKLRRQTYTSSRPISDNSLRLLSIDL